jgi:hypothetical protein
MIGRAPFAVLLAGSAHPRPHHAAGDRGDIAPGVIDQFGALLATLAEVAVRAATTATRAHTPSTPFITSTPPAPATAPTAAPSRRPWTSFIH